MFNLLIAFFFWKTCTFPSFEKHVPFNIFPSFERFVCWKCSNYSQHYSLEISFAICLTWVINYWDSIFTFYLTWGVFSLVCVLSVFFFFLFSFLFLFLSVFSLTDTNNSQDSRKGSGNHYFSCFSLPPAQEYSVS